MPMPGDEFVKELRRSGFTKPIIVISGGFHMVEDLLNSLDVQRVFPKPFQLRELLYVIDSLV